MYKSKAVKVVNNDYNCNNIDYDEILILTIIIVLV